MAKPARFCTVHDLADKLATDEATLRKVHRKLDPDHLAPAVAALDFYGSNEPLRQTVRSVIC